jgi:PPOX class probable F420-dependent enzyme
MSRIGEAYARKLTVARLATVGADGRPHCVPVCYAIDGQRALVMTDAKSKKARNIQATGVAALAVDDGQAVRGVMIEGPARFIEDEEGFEAAQDKMLAAGALQTKRAFREQVIVEIDCEQWVEWGLEAK